MTSPIEKFFMWFLGIIFFCFVIVFGILNWMEFKKLRKDVAEIKEKVEIIDTNIRYIEMNTTPADAE